jgi:23S rRNA (guanosine2251-2'-O)-methyltransferase
MVERSRRGKGKHKLLGSHQRCWLWGRNLVSETLSAGKWPILELYLADDLPPEQLQRSRAQAASQGVPVQVGSRDALQRLCHSSEHQGYLAKMPPFPFADAEQVLAARLAQPLCLVLDSIQDPHNFGAMLRSAEVFGVDAAFIGAQRQVEVTSHVARSSAGAINRIPIARVDDLAGMASRFAEVGIDVVGASEKAERTADRYDFRRPTAIVIGNEGTGITPALAARCTELVRIPQYGAIGSLNAAAAAAILFYEARRQRAGA